MSLQVEDVMDMQRIPDDAQYLSGPRLLAAVQAVLYYCVYPDRFTIISEMENDYDVKVTLQCPGQEGAFVLPRDTYTRMKMMEKLVYHLNTVLVSMANQVFDEATQVPREDEGTKVEKGEQNAH